MHQAGRGQRLWRLWFGLLAIAAVIVVLIAVVPSSSPEPSGSGTTAVAADPSDADVSPAAKAKEATGSIVPAHLTIPSIGVDASVEHRGTVEYTNEFTGAKVAGYGVPESMHTTSWWSDGPKPGSGKMAVVLGHEQVGGGSGVFNDLDKVASGAKLTLTAKDGSYLKLKVLSEPVTGLDKSTSALSDTLNGHPADADIALVTCGGEFDSAKGASEDNTVVFASVVR